MGKKIIDLHVHTSFSDGTFTPKEAVEYALRRNIAAIAITDHDSVDGVAPAYEASRKSRLEVVAGVELSAEVENYEIHILGLLVDTNVSWFLERLKQIRQARIVRMQKMVDKLNIAGIDITLEDVLALNKNDGAVGRLHLARILYEKEYVHSFREAFERYIGRNGSCYVKRLVISPQEAIEMIKRVKGIPVLAHPGNMSHDEIIPDLVRQGLMGIEVFHIDHGQESMLRYTKIAKKHGLLISGGSDCHGEGKGFPLMGKVIVPYGVLEKLREAKVREYGE